MLLVLMAENIKKEADRNWNAVYTYHTRFRIHYWNRFKDIFGEIQV